MDTVRGLVEAGVLLIGAGWMNSGFSRTLPPPDYLAYVLDADTDQAHWATVPDRLDAWTQQFFSHAALPESISFTPSPDHFPIDGSQHSGRPRRS